MLYSDRINISEGTDINQASASKECTICLYCCFLDKGFKFQPDVCNECHDLLMLSVNFNDIVIFNIHSIDCFINRISKSEVVNLLQNADLSGKKGTQ